MKRQKKKTGRYHAGADSDIAKASDLGLLIESGGDVVTAYLKYLTLVTRKWINQGITWKAIEAVANELLTRGTIEGESRIAELMEAVLDIGTFSYVQVGESAE